MSSLPEGLTPYVPGGGQLRKIMKPFKMVYNIFGAGADLAKYLKRKVRKHFYILDEGLDIGSEWAHQYRNELVKYGSMGREEFEKVKIDPIFESLPKGLSKYQNGERFLEPKFERAIQLLKNYDRVVTAWDLYLTEKLRTGMNREEFIGIYGAYSILNRAFNDKKEILDELRHESKGIKDERNYILDKWYDKLNRVDLKKLKKVLEKIAPLGEEQSHKEHKSTNDINSNIDEVKKTRERIKSD